MPSAAVRAVSFPNVELMPARTRTPLIGWPAASVTVPDTLAPSVSTISLSKGTLLWTGTWTTFASEGRARNVVFESGRYIFANATLSGYGAIPSDPDYDPYLHVWESAQGIDSTALGVIASELAWDAVLSSFDPAI